MNVVEANAGLLSNFEVLDLLRTRGADRGPLGGSITVAECKVYEYLVETPAGTLTRKAIGDFVAESKCFNLTEAEKLQAVNLRSSTAVEVHLIVEDCDERLSKAQVDRFIETMTEILPEPPSRPEEEDEAIEEDEPVGDQGDPGGGEEGEEADDIAEG